MKTVFFLGFITFSTCVFAQNFNAVQQQDSGATGLTAGQTAKLSVYSVSYTHLTLPTNREV